MYGPTAPSKFVIKLSVPFEISKFPFGVVVPIPTFPSAVTSNKFVELFLTLTIGLVVTPLQATFPGSVLTLPCNIINGLTPVSTEGSTTDCI